MREIVHTEAAPGSVSPVSQATRGGGFVFIGGQMPRDMATGQIVEGAAAQARLSLSHCLAILAAAGSDASKVMRADVFVTDLAAKDAVNTAFRDAFGNSPPARNMVEVTTIGEEAIVEIGLVALA